MADKYADLTVPERIEKALELLREHPDISLRKASTICNVHASSLSRRHRGVTSSRKKVSQERQLLTPAEEETLIKYALLYSSRGLPLHIKQLRQLASEMLHRKSCKLELGLHWHLALLRRNPHIKETLSQPVQRSRGAVTKEPAAKQWFTLFHELRTEHGIQDEQIYNMDEKGLMLGPVQRSTVLVSMEQKQAYIRDGGKQEWVSIIECVKGGVNCKAISPFIISRSKRHQSAWFDGSNSNARVDQREKVWTDKEISLNWLSNHFHPLTLPPDPNTKRLLIVNGHESHCTIDFIEFCDTHNIILLILPPHATQFLQPLDISCFGAVEQAYSTEVEAHGQYNGTFVEESEFIVFYQHARFFGLRPANIAAGFQATGLIPYNPQLIYDKIANAGPATPREKLVVPNADREDMETMRKIRSLVETINDVSVRQALLDKL
jgi:DDE superfamily endonuclease